MPDPNQLESFVSAARRMGGAYGTAWIDGIQQTDVIQVQAGITIGRSDVPLVGQRRVGFKATSISPDGTLSTQKIDDRWELFVYNQTAISDEDRIAARDAGNFDIADPTFSLKLVLNDPQAYGRSAWQLDGCRLWAYNLGSGITDETVGREYPLTWDNERPIDAFEIQRGSTKVQKYLGGAKVG